MPLDHAQFSAEARAARLSDRISGPDALAQALVAPEAGSAALVSSFGADSVVLLHMVAQIDRTLPVLFIDSRMLFDETLAYQRELAETLSLTDIRVIRPRHVTLVAQDRDETLHQRDPDACCSLRKTQPLQEALAGFDTWITGRKRHQSATRADLPLFEADGARVKMNPLKDWTAVDVSAYIDRHTLPRHPLIAQGYPSIGCVPCTSPVAKGEDPRAGRWRGQTKEECGIHFINGKAVRTKDLTQEPRP